MMNLLHSSSLKMLTNHTLRVVEQHNAAWQTGDIALITALYHPDMRFIDHFSGQTYSGDALRAHVTAIIERSHLDTLKYTDRPRVDGEMAFLRYKEVIRSANGDALLTFTACDAVCVRDNLIVEIHEYAIPNSQPALKRIAHSAEKIGLSPRMLGYLLDDIGQYIESLQPHLNPGFSLTDLAKATGYTRNQISFALNHGLGRTFYAYINEIRVKRMLRDTVIPLNSVVDVARKAGFRSSSTFYSAFKAVTGKTPKQYWAKENV